MIKFKNLSKNHHSGKHVFATVSLPASQYFQIFPVRSVVVSDAIFIYIVGLNVSTLVRTVEVNQFFQNEQYAIMVANLQDSHL